MTLFFSKDPNPSLWEMTSLAGWRDCGTPTWLTTTTSPARPSPAPRRQRTTFQHRQHQNWRMKLKGNLAEVGLVNTLQRFHCHRSMCLYGTLSLVTQATSLPLLPLRNLLHNHAYNPSVITWVDENVGCFKISNTVEFARTWGKMKANRYIVTTLTVILNNSCHS